MSNEPIPPLCWRFEDEQLTAMSDVELAAQLYDQVDGPEEGLAERTAQLETAIARRGLSREYQRATLPPFRRLVDYG
jgi:hypothetical protein